ncbi:MAG: HDIG domain-containing protein [Bacteroidales bacterium]|nr:HDIG domain-containing protein [Bacteroidales bacterium]
MDSRKLRILLSLVAVAVMLTFLVPYNSKFGYDYKKGQPWEYEDLYSQFDFPIIKTEDQLLQERINTSETFIPYFKYSSEVVSSSVRAAEKLDLGICRNPVVSDLRFIYEKGVVADEIADPNCPVIYVQKDKHAVKRPSSDVFTVSEARGRLVSDIISLQLGINVDSLFQDQKVLELVVPNLIYDQQTTNLVKAQSDNNISPTSGFVSAGELLVSEGEIVTSEIFQILDSYKKEYETNIGHSFSGWVNWLSNFILFLSILTVFFFVILFTTPRIFYDNRFFYLLTVFVLASVTCLVVARINEELLFLVPFTLSGLYLNAFFKPKVIMSVYIVSLLPILVFTHAGMVPFILFLTAGFVSIYVFKIFHKGWRQFVSAMINFAVLALVYLAFSLNGMVEISPMRMLIYLFISSILNVLCYPMVFLFEKVFNLVSNSRLAELCDTSNPLLRDLEAKAPGTFQHSLQVMNLASAAARSIDANPVLLRAGALYHDIGKMNNPQCFIENESLINKAPEEKYHASLSPEQSAQDIIRHVTDGIELAEKNHLPETVIDFIRSHHGTSTVGYFYNKYLNNGGDPSGKADFTYPGQRPKRKEEVILMLCDSVEAASRTLNDYSMESISNFVDSILKSKASEEQFENSDITINELNTVKSTICQYLAQMHHERIVYPKRKNK